MANTLYPPPRPQSVGEILDSAFRIFRATLMKCLPYAIAAVIAGQLPNIYYLVSGRNMLQGLAGFRDPVWLTLYILGYVIAIVLWSAVLLRQYALSTGHPADTSSELSTAVRRVPAMALLGILTGCAVAVWFLPTLALQGTARLATALVLAIPACYLVVASLVHSFRLTSGSFWRLTLIYTVAFVLLMVLYLVSGLLAGLVSVLLAHGDIAVITAATTVFVVILSAVGTPFFWALALAVLGDLSVRKEGADLAQRLSSPAAS
ncbi:MAG: hypothetical protein E6K51_07785 [Gammaproteobacteria bacterium]|nr:MAG: hypothetical protein E6K51_07785 [Gammaproteobacteria bacterium]